jgi:hypothetical protein
LLGCAAALLAGGCGVGASTSTVTVKQKSTVTTGATVTETLTTTVGSTDATAATNLVVTPRVRIQLRSAVTDGKSQAEAAKIKGPLPKSIYYAEYQGFHYALASFSFPLTGTTDQPLLFVELPGIGYLVEVSDTGGDPGHMSAIPCPVREVWNLGC